MNHAKEEIIEQTILIPSFSPDDLIGAILLGSSGSVICKERNV